MALVRWADDSQLYIFGRGGYWECHLCPFVPHGGAILRRCDVIPHVQAHRDAGHRVPDDMTDEDIRAYVYDGA